MGQSLWLDNITRGLLTSGTLRRYIQGEPPSYRGSDLRGCAGQRDPPILLPTVRGGGRSLHARH